MPVFSSEDEAKAHQKFVDWIDANPKGFVINRRGAGLQISTIPTPTWGNSGERTVEALQISRPEAAARTVEAMRSGADVIYQPVFLDFGLRTAHTRLKRAGASPPSGLQSANHASPSSGLQVFQELGQGPLPDCKSSTNQPKRRRAAALQKGPTVPDANID